MRSHYMMRGAVVLSLILFAGSASAQVPPQPFRGFGPLVPAALGEAVDAPSSLSVTALSRVGDFMTDALHVPMLGSGVGVFPLDEGKMVLLIGHDIPPGTPSRSGPFGMESYRLMTGRDTSNVYDLGPTGEKPSYGSVTATIVDSTGRIALQNRLAIGGLMRAFRGASTRWGTWLIGEAETRVPDERYAKPHGYVFEVDPAEPTRRPHPLPALGRFAHAGITQDPVGGAIFMTEAREDGLLYRFQPAIEGDLSTGTLSVLEVSGSGASVESSRARWLELDAEDSGVDDLRVRGAARGASAFINAGGLMWADGTLYICAPRQPGGPSLWVLRASNDDLSLEAIDLPPGAPADVTDVAMSPWGSLLVVGTGADGHARLVAVSEDGGSYPVLRSARSDGRISAPSFSPDGRTIFVSLPVDGLLLSIKGPWPQR